MEFSIKAKEFGSAEISRERYNNEYQKAGVTVPVGSENPFSTQRVKPVERTTEISNPERTNRYVQDQDLFASLNAIGTGELKPEKYDEFTGNRFDMYM